MFAVPFAGTPRTQYVAGVVHLTGCGESKADGVARRTQNSARAAAARRRPTRPEAGDVRAIGGVHDGSIVSVDERIGARAAHTVTATSP